jgi:hypothetical protein
MANFESDAPKIDVHLLPNVELQWYFQERPNLPKPLDASKYNNGSPTKTLSDLSKEMERKIFVDSKKFKDLCSGKHFYMHLAYANIYDAALICRQETDESDNDGEVLGFALIKFLPDEHNDTANPPQINLNISIFCGHRKYSGVGKKLMLALKQFAKDMSIAKIAVKSDVQATGFYGNQGFQRFPEGSNNFVYTLPDGDDATSAPHEIAALTGDVARRSLKTNKGGKRKHFFPTKTQRLLRKRSGQRRRKTLRRRHCQKQMR